MANPLAEMETKELHIDYITFPESEQVVALAPQLELCFNASSESQSLESLEMGAKALFEYWREKNILEDKISTLGLNGKTTPEQKQSIQKELSVPYFLLHIKDRKSGTLNISIEI